VQKFNAAAQKEATDILSQAARGVKQSLGMMIQRHLRIASGVEPLSQLSEYYSAGAGVSSLYEVDYSHSFWSRVVCVYETVGTDFTLLAIDAYQGTARLGLPASDPNAKARAWGRSS
jgi:hypothetical protein